MQCHIFNRKLINLFNGQNKDKSEKVSFKHIFVCTHCLQMRPIVFITDLGFPQTINLSKVM